MAAVVITLVAVMLVLAERRGAELRCDRRRRPAAGLRRAKSGQGLFQRFLPATRKPDRQGGRRPPVRDDGNLHFVSNGLVAAVPATVEIGIAMTVMLAL
jgi:hypothetical protein